MRIVKWRLSCLCPSSPSPPEQMDELVDIITYSSIAIVGLAFLAVLTVVLIHFLAQRSQQHQNEIAQQNLANIHSMGIQAIIASNEMVIVDESLQSRKTVEENE